MTERLRYRAFISYSHRDAASARKLHRRLEAYRLPKDLPLANLPSRHLRPVFLDRDELASASALSDSLCSALDEAAALIVVCSPAAAQSRWVNEEIRYFRSRHPQRPTLAFVIAGDPGADPRIADNSAALPLALLLADPERPDAALREPIAADARADADGFDGALLKTIAGLLGVRFDDLRRREFRRRQQQWIIISAASLLLTVSFAWLAWQATQARNEARAAQARAELELTTEQQTRQFLLSVFQLADPNENRGNQVTVREVLDQAVARIDQTTFAQPVIKSRFLATLGRAYASLGLNRRSSELLHASLAALPTEDQCLESVLQRIDVRTELANVHYSAGDYELALEHAERAAQLSQAIPLDAVRLGRIQVALGDANSRSETPESARAHYQRALDSLQALPDTDPQVVSVRGNAQLGLAYLDFDAGDHAAAEVHFASASAMLERAFGQRHPLTLAALGSRGSNAYARADRNTARKAWSDALQVSLQVFDTDAPEVGTLKSNLGLLALEDGDLASAESYLRAALASDRKHRSSDFDDLAYALHNLAYARLVAGDTDEASRLLAEALPIAEARKHDMLGPILLALADNRCLSDQAELGRDTSLRAGELVKATLDASHWRQQQAILIHQYCLAQAGQTVDQQAARAALAGIRKRWPEQSAYVRRALLQWQAITAAAR